MSQAPTVPPAVDAHKKQDVIEAMRSLSNQDQKDVAQQCGSIRTAATAFAIRHGLA